MFRIQKPNTEILKFSTKIERALETPLATPEKLPKAQFPVDIPADNRKQQVLWSSGHEWQYAVGGSLSKSEWLVIDIIPA